MDGRRREGDGRPKGTGAAHQGAHKLRHRPAVAAAIQACLADRNVGARVDWGWLLHRLYRAVRRLEDVNTPAAAALVGGGSG